MSDFNVFDDGKNDGGNKEMLATFCQELAENIVNLESALIDLEKSRDSKDHINHTFRVFHNTKGSSAMMGFVVLVDVAHWAESLLDLVRNDKMTLKTEHVDELLKAVSALKEIGERIKKDGKEGPERYFKLLARLQELAEESGDPSAKENKSLDLEQDAGLQKKAKANEDELIKVSRGLIDGLMLLVSDFMLLKNRFSWVSNRYQKDNELADNCRELDIFSSKLQQSAFKMRLSPIAPVFASMQRVVRQTAADCGKKVSLVINGGETLLDRAIVDAIGEPMIHLLRNAIDHGLEKPDDRLAVNKPAEGMVTLSAQYRSGEVYLAITDDGRGIDHIKIKDIAVKKGLLTASQGDALSVQEMLNLIFLPGFSSAEVISKVSGRGVGMDIVKSALEKIGGHIEIITEKGVGTTFAIHLPLSLAIVDCLGFTVGGQSYALAQSNIEEVFSVHSSQTKDSVKQLADGSLTLIVRDVPIPVISLSKVFEKNGSTEAFILVHYGKNRFVIEVDKVLGPMSVVSQPLPEIFQGSQFYSGVTKQGDGSLLFQVDVSRISALVNNTPVKEANKTSYVTSEGKTESAGMLRSSDVRRLQQKIIAFANGLDFCIPVQRARQIINVKRKDMKFIRSGGPSYFNLDDQTVPLIWIEEHLLEKDRIVKDEYPVVIVSIRGQVHGIPLAEFKGIKRMPENYDRSIISTGISGSTVIDGTPYLVVDVNELVQISQSKMKGPSLVPAVKKIKILTAEDDSFFASEMISSLKGANYEAILCKDGLEAKNYLENPDLAKTIDLVITDIEMPNLNGIGLLRWIKSNQLNSPSTCHASFTRPSSPRRRGKKRPRPVPWP